VNKQHFLERLIHAGEAARQFAAGYVLESLPKVLCFTLSPYNDPNGRPGPPGTIKFLGGRLIRPDELRQLPATRAAAFLWVDGKVPAWINIAVAECLENQTELRLRFSRMLVPADEKNLQPDAGWPKANDLAPFRIRGPILPRGWRSLELDGAFSLAASSGCPDSDADSA
jgi:hypothetical protein